MRWCRRVCFILLILYILHPVSAFSADKLTVFVSILPQKYFVQQIGKDFVDVHVMVLPGASPATYEPKPRQMTTLSRADIYFSIGVPFEKVWLQKIVAATPEMKLIPIDRGIEKISMMPVHEDEKNDHHDHGALDPHIWLSPPLVKKQARTILEALIEVDPDKALEYQSNYDVFIFEIDRLDMELKNIFADRQGLKFMVFHPSWGYFARTYGLMQVPIEIEGKDPKPAQLKKLIETARAQHIKVVFVQPQFSSRSARQIAREIGVQVVTADSLALNWSENLEEVAGKIKAVLNLK